MPKNRLEAFSDGVIAIVITLLVLEIKVPPLTAEVRNHVVLQALWDMGAATAAYAISFLVCAVWWVAHHNFIDGIEYVDRGLLWANNIFLLFLVFLPIPTALLGQHPGQPVAVALYGVVGALTGLSFWVMRWHATVRARLMKESITAPELHRRLRVGLLSPALYLMGTLVAFAAPVIAMCIYAAIPTYFAFSASANLVRRV